MMLLFNVMLSGYVAALFFSIMNLLVKRQYLDWFINGLLVSTNVIHLVYIIWRWKEAGRPPFSNMFESLVLFAWATVFVYMVIRYRINVPVLGTATALIATVTLAYASSFTSAIEPLVPALRSNWLTFHVFTCFMGYAGFALAFVSAIAYLVITRRAGEQDQLGASVDSIMIRTVAFGFVFLSIGIITGAVWANSAWGTYWSWDPKETWSLITWFIYAAFLHCRYMRGWTGRRAAWISIIGFLSVLFTYVGVNLLLKGLHSYA